MDKQKIETLKAKNQKVNACKLQKTQKKEAKKSKLESLRNKKNTQFSKVFNKRKKAYLEKQRIAILGRHEKIETKLQKDLDFAVKESKSSKTKGKTSFINKFLVSFNTKRIQKVQASFQKKREKTRLLLKIEKINKQKAQLELEKININEGLIINVLEKRIQSARNKTKIQTLEDKIQNNKSLLHKKLKDVEAKEKKEYVPNFLKSLVSWWGLLKSRYVFNLQIGSVLKKVSNHFRKYSMYYILAFIILVFAISTDFKNLKPDNIVNILESNTYILIIGLGMLLVIVGGYIDLSVGALLGFAGALSVEIYNALGGNIGLTVLLTTLFGLGFGFFQGVLIGYFKMPAFIVTLAGMLLFQGLILTITNSMTLTPTGGFESSYVEFVTGSIPDIVINDFHLFSFLLIFSCGLISVFLLYTGRTKRARYGIFTDSKTSFLVKSVLIISMFASFAFLIGTSLFGMKYYMVYIMLLIVIFIFITQNTTFGRQIYAMGGNKKAAILSGINVKRTTVYIFMIIGGLSAFGSIIFTGITTNATPSAGSGYELDVISSVFVGGASMQGGVGTVPGTIIGGLVLGFINNGMSLMNYASDLKKITKALVLLAAVGYDVYANRKIS